MGLDRELWPSGGGLLGKATTPGIADHGGCDRPPDLLLGAGAIVPRLQPQNDTALRHGRVAGDGEHPIGLGNGKGNGFQLLGVGVGVFDGGSLGTAEHGHDVPLILDRGELAFQRREQEITRSGHGQTDHENERAHGECALQ